MGEDVKLMVLGVLDRHGYETCVGAYEDPRDCAAAEKLISRRKSTRSMQVCYHRLIRSADGRGMKLWGQSCFDTAVILLCTEITERHPAVNSMGYFPLNVRAFEDAADAVKAREQLLKEPEVVSVTMITVPLFKRAATNREAE